MSSSIESALSPLRILIVDDEPLARKILREMLADEILSGKAEILGECSDGRAAVKEVLTAKPNLLFLDVQMPEMNGFDVLSALPPEELPFIVFVTAFDQYALQAFEVYALDYLLKPFDRERFEQTLERAKNAIIRERTSDINGRILTLLEEQKALSPPQPLESPQHYLDRLIIKSDGRVFFLRTEEITWVKADGNYVSLFDGKKSYLFRETIGSLENQLDPRKFQRIHRSAIVNIDYIEELQPMFRGEFTVLLTDGTKLKLSHNYRNKLQHKLGGSF